MIQEIRKVLERKAAKVTAVAALSGLLLAGSREAYAQGAKTDGAEAALAGATTYRSGTVGTSPNATSWRPAANVTGNIPFSDSPRGGYCRVTFTEPTLITGVRNVVTGCDQNNGPNLPLNGYPVEIDIWTSDQLAAGNRMQPDVAQLAIIPSNALPWGVTTFFGNTRTTFLNNYEMPGLSISGGAPVIAPPGDIVVHARYWRDTAAVGVIAVLCTGSTNGFDFTITQTNTVKNLVDGTSGSSAFAMELVGIPLRTLAPTLQVTNTNNGVNVSWMCPFDVFQLQHSTNALGGWENVASPISRTNDTWTASFQPDQPNRFFRLVGKSSNYQ